MHNQHKRVWIVYHYFPHYRLPLMKKLMKEENITYTFISGTTTDQEILTINPNFAQVSINEGGLNWEFIDNIWLFGKRFLWQKGLIKKCFTGGYDCVIFLGNPYFLSTWIALFVCKFFGKKTFLWGHGIIRGQKRDYFKIIFFKLANALLLYGNHAKQDFEKRGFNSKKIYTIYNSLDYDRQLQNRTRLSKDVLQNRRNALFLHSDKPVLLFIGRLTQVKKLESLLMVCEKLHSMDFPVNLLIIGDGSEKNKLLDLVRGKNLLEYVVFYGECYDENELAPLIALSDVCVSPGNVGLTAMHSLTYGTPVITHNNPNDQMPEYEAIEPGVNGMLFEYGFIDSLLNAILAWLQDDTRSREQIRKDCYKPIDRYYNPDFQAKVLREAILEVCGGNPS